MEARGLTKRYGDTLAVDNLSFDITPGIVTGFLGPNGSGKSTTMRMILGLDNPTAGSVTIDSKAYRDLPAPMHKVGSLLDAGAIQGGRTARQHLRWVAQAAGFSRRRIDEVFDTVGLTDVAGKKVGGFSLGMSQRWGIATALLGDPEVLLLVASEYSSGMMRLTLSITPQRGRIVLAKAIIITAVAIVAGVIISIANFQVAQMIFGAYALLTATLGDSDAFRAVVVGTVVTGPVFPLLGVALAFIFRSTALAITTVLALIFAPSFFGGLLPRRWQEDVLAYLLGQAADSFAIGHLYPDSPMYLDPTVGLIVAGVWTVGALVAATIVLNRRDM